MSTSTVVGASLLVLFCWIAWNLLDGPVRLARYRANRRARK